MIIFHNSYQCLSSSVTLLPTYLNAAVDWTSCRVEGADQEDKLPIESRSLSKHKHKGKSEHSAIDRLIPGCSTNTPECGQARNAPMAIDPVLLSSLLLWTGHYRVTLNT